MERHAIDVLRQLGFNEYEARAVYALLRLREADVREISRLANIPRTKTYEVLRSLAKKGYVAEIQAKPIRYSIIDPDGFLDKLYYTKKKELERLRIELNTLKHVLPALSERSEQSDNYIVKVATPDDFLKLISKRMRPPTLVGYTRESEKYLRGVGDESYKSPFDFILTPAELYIPLNPLGRPQREYVIAVFTNPYIMEMLRRWIREVLS